MKELIVRSISGLLYISIIIFAMFASREWFIALFFLLGLFTIYEYQKIVHLKSYISYPILAVLMYFLSYEVFDQNAVYLYAIIGIFVNLFLLKEMLSERKIPLFENKKYIALLFYLISGFVFLTLIPLRKDGATIVIGMFVLIWSNDSCAYLVGKNFGKRKLLERVSPKKTIEGFLGGFAGSLLAGFIIFNYTQTLTLGVWMAMAVTVSFLGTCGDLIQSKFKRQAGVKDSGTLMPGHGGMYDRLDSIIYTSPFVYVLLEIVNYVS
ncbi:MAG: phosphatidate cytidylyltransferase [Bacteroidota bacterium]